MHEASKARDSSKPRARRAAGPWHVSLGRFLGRATRWAVTELRTLERARPPEGARDPKPLLEKLAQRLEEHAMSHFSTAQEDPRLWVLIAELNAHRQVRRRPSRARRAALPENAPRRSAEPADLSPSEHEPGCDAIVEAQLDPPS
ncbi:MAG: hypothetical protein OEY14_02860, partial [Myxococcales bacterium]|nr:hypothetical protein [Myxococcales bacterium]